MMLSIFSNKADFSAVSCIKLVYNPAVSTAKGIAI